MEIQDFKFQVSDSEKNLIFNAIEGLFTDLDTDIERSALVDAKDRSVNLFLFKKIAKIIKDNKITLINAFPIEPDKFLLKFAVTKDTGVKAIFTFIATNDIGKIRFLSPIKHSTKHWKTKQIGNVKYYYKDAFNEKIAKQFDQKNTEIAKKFGISVKKLDYYKCSNYEEVQRLLGIDFDTKSAGTVQSCEDFENTIITGINSENYCHDVFHMYIETKFPDGENRNFIAEEGYANSIADAYYAKLNGEIISRRELVLYLKEYLENNSETDLLELFENDPRVYFQLSSKVSYEVFNELSVRSTIVSLICDEVEKVKGFEGLIKVLRCGRGEDAFFIAINNLISLNKLNFDKKVRELIWRFS